MGGCIAAERERGELLMANYLTTDTDLTTVADAIRTKGGTSAALEWPSGYAQAIADIPSGGGVETAVASFNYYDGFTIAYTDADMQACTAVLGSSFSSSMPLGSMVTLVKNAMQEPVPFSPSYTGVVRLVNESGTSRAGKTIEVNVFKVTG